MMINLEEKLVKYMQEKGKKDLVLYTKASSGGCCGGKFINVKVRFAEEGDAQLLQSGYVTAETELGVVYYHPEKLIIGKRPRLILNQFLNMTNIQAMDIGTMGQDNVRGIPV